MQSQAPTANLSVVFEYEGNVFQEHGGGKWNGAQRPRNLFHDYLGLKSYLYWAYRH